MELLKKDIVDGVTCYRCEICNEILIRVEGRGIFGGELNSLDILVIQDHCIAKHG